MGLLRTVFLLGFLCCALGIGAQEIPDSLVSEDNVYRYMFSDTRKAEAIMAALRERGDMEKWELDFVEGDLYYNTGRNYKALSFYVPVLESRKAHEDIKLNMDILHRLISCYDFVHNSHRRSQCIDMLMQQAEKAHDEAMRAVALFNLGKSQYEEGKKDEGYKNMEAAAQLMDRTTYKNKYDNLRYHYNTLLDCYERDQRAEDAMRTVERLDGVVDATTGSEKTMDGLALKERKALMGHRAIVLDMMGYDAAAEECYKRFLEMGQPADKETFVIMPYLFRHKLYDEVFRIAYQRAASLRAEGDTVNYHYATVLVNLGKACYDMGDYRRSADYYSRLADLNDSIKMCEQSGMSHELVDIYEGMEREREFHNHRVMDMTLVGVVLAVTVVLLGILVYTRRLRHRNAKLVRVVEAGIGYRDELNRERAANVELRGQLATLNAHDDGDSVVDEDKARFEMMCHEMVDNEYYLRPGISKKDVQELTQYPVSQMGAAFKKYAGMSFVAYVNKLRMEHAAKLLIENPDYTVEAIAQMCGVESRQHFHRLFADYYGITPTAFREVKKV